MSWATPFLATSLSPGLEDTDRFHGDEDGDEGEGFESRWISRRVLSHRDEEHLGMWAARLKVMAGTQHLLPTIPAVLPPILTHPHRHLHPHPYPIASYPSTPPASPLPLSGRPSAAQRVDSITSEAATACNKIMRLASTLERRRNAERRLSRKNRSQQPPVRVVRPAAPSTVPAVGDDSPCTEATVHPPRPSPQSPLSLVGLLVDSPPPSVQPVAPIPLGSVLRRTYTDVSTDPHPTTVLRDAAVDALPPRTFTDASVGTSDVEDDHRTTYGIISDPFARSLARLLPLEFDRERKFTRSIYLADWLPWAEWFASEHLPPTQRVYLNVLAEIFRPWCDPEHGCSLALQLNPVYNLFTHWWSGWNAIGFPTRPPERNPRLRYDYLSDPELHGEVALVGRGFIVVHASDFL